MINKYNLLKKIKKHLTFTALLTFGIMLSVSTVFLANLISKKPVDFRGRAGSEEKSATIYLYPKEISISANNSFNISPKIVGPDNKKIASVILSYQFDKSLLEFKGLNTDSTINNNQLLILKQSSTDEANQQGIVNLFLGAQDSENAPSQVVNLPQLTFGTNKVGVSFINLDTGKIQVVYTNGEMAEVKIDGSVTIDSRGVPEQQPKPSEMPTLFPNKTIENIPSSIPSLEITNIPITRTPKEDIKLNENTPATSSAIPEPSVNP